MLSSTSARITAAEFLSWPEDPRHRRHELIDGVPVVSQPNVVHQELCGRLYLAIGNFLAVHPHLGRVFLPLAVVLSDHDVIVPDLIVVTPDRQRTLTEEAVYGAPTLAIEVLSPSTRRRDEGVKRRLLDEQGAREYWLVDPKKAQISVFRRAKDGSFPRVTELGTSADARLTSPLLPGFSHSVSALFADP
jgi:Uma2 family endonuclease